MKSKKLSARQLAVAVMVGGLSAGAAAAGRSDWRWLLAAAALGTAAGWLLLRRMGGWPLHPVLRALYGGWAVVLMAQALGRTAGRLQPAAEGNAVWLALLLALPLAWMGWGKAGAFFRAVEVLWLAVLAAVAAILLLGLPRTNWAWALEPGGSWGGSLLAGVLPMSAGLYTLPHLYKVKEGEGAARRELVWLGALGVLCAGLTLLTAGLLSPAVAVQLDDPFFTAAGLLGDSARLEARSWGERRLPALAVLAAAGLALSGAADAVTGDWAAAGCLGLAVLTAVLPPQRGK